MRTVIVSILASFLTVTAIQFVPTAWFFHESHLLGSTITTINGSDTISSSRTTINNNFSALNTSKAEISDVSGTTTLNSLAKVGTITQGVWNGTAVTVPYGGTGSTTLSSNQVLLGNGTGILKTVSGFGSSGDVLQSNGAGVAPSWASVSVNQTSSYSWTGTHSWSNTATFNGTFAINGTPSIYSALNLLSFTATSTTATSTVSGNLLVSKNASTSYLQVTNGCSGCANPTIISNAFGVLDGGTPSQSTQTATCTGVQKVSGCGINGGTGNSISGQNAVVYPSSATVCTGKVWGANGSTANPSATVYAICINP